MSQHSPRANDSLIPNWYSKHSLREHLSLAERDQSFCFSANYSASFKVKMEGKTNLFKVHLIVQKMPLKGHFTRNNCHMYVSE